MTQSTPRFRVVVTDYDYVSFDEERAVLGPTGAELVLEHARTEEELVAACRGADALLVQYGRMTARVIDSLDRWRGIVR